MLSESFLHAWKEEISLGTRILLWVYGKTGNGNEMETGNGNQKLKTEMETQHLSCCSPSKIQVFVPRHPSALPASSFLIGCFASLASLASFPGFRQPQFSLEWCKSLFYVLSSIQSLVFHT